MVGTAERLSTGRGEYAAGADPPETPSCLRVADPTGNSSTPSRENANRDINHDQRVAGSSEGEHLARFLVRSNPGGSALSLSRDATTHCPTRAPSMPIISMVGSMVRRIASQAYPKAKHVRRAQDSPCLVKPAPRPGAAKRPRESQSDEDFA